MAQPGGVGRAIRALSPERVEALKPVKPDTLLDAQSVNPMPKTSLAGVSGSSPRTDGGLEVEIERLNGV